MSEGSSAPQWRYGDLREWMREAEKLGELRTVRGASWQEEIGLAADVVVPRDDAPAVVFDEVPGCPRGFRLLVNVFGGRRRNMTLGFPDHLTKQELSEAYFEHYQKNPRYIAPEFVEDGPVLENVLTGEDVDVEKFPAPIWHVHDGGRYIGTGGYSVTMDPDERWINVGCYRAMIHDRRTVGMLIVPGKHGYMHREKYFGRGQRMPLALVVGGDPVLFFMAGTEHPYGVCEFDIAGGMRGRPVKLVRGRVTGLPFPADAEVVLEGFVSQEDRRREGPFGEWTGYYAGGASPQPVLHVEAIYHRNDPVLLGVPPLGGGSDEMARYRAVIRSAMLKRELANAGVPDVRQVWCHEVGASRMLHGIAIKQRYPGQAKQVGVLAASCGSTVYGCKFVIVVDDDVDVSNFEQLMWAMATRCDPATSMDILRRMRTSPADPRLTPEQRAMKDLTNSRVVIDATRPFEWADKFPRVNAPAPEVSRKAREKFGYLLE
ncbi:MAG TPA: UbiD family decarboxylase [candidate division Zixibacteria bacterium]|nr:UbiD family decarboxylase [candidate division Zixibacteria bacterium]